MDDWALREANAGDAQAIQALIHKVHINPMGLDWRHFILAVAEDGALLGCGQIKVHRDGSRELASIAVEPAARGSGIARAVIEALLQRETRRPLYLMCRSRLEPLYAKFGFQAIQYHQMPVYFQRISRVAKLFNTGSEPGDQLSVMRLTGGES